MGTHTTERGTSTPSPVFDQEVEALRDDSDVDYSDWFCIATAPFNCPAEGCDFVAHHMTAAHLVVVWPEKDDRKLLECANDAQQLGRQPRIEEYEPQAGPCIAYDVWVAIGRPVHGQLQRPGDKPFKSL